jgi:hypothetical protein
MKFLIKAGRHIRQSVTPKHRNVFRCEPGAVLDGESVTDYAFRRASFGSGPDSVRIIGCVIENYVPAFQMGAILAGGHTLAEGTIGWIVDSCEVRYNANLGVRLGERMSVRWSRVHHNGTLGIGGRGDSILILGNEISHNNYQLKGDPGFEAGGTKFVLTTWLRVRENWVHHNEGPGLWTDFDNDDVVYEDNVVEDNAREGIVHEVSYSAVIRNNQVRRNGLRDPRRLVWPWGAGIGIHGAPDVEVYGNTVEDNAHGVAAIQQDRGAGRLGPFVVLNLWVHDNTIAMPTGMTGVVQDLGSQTVFSEGNNRFTTNTYRLTGNPRPFAWLDGLRTELEWTAYGQDSAGSFIR